MQIIRVLEPDGETTYRQILYGGGTPRTIRTSETVMTCSDGSFVHNIVEYDRLASESDMPTYQSTVVVLYCSSNQVKRIEEKQAKCTLCKGSGFNAKALPDATGALYMCDCVRIDELDPTVYV